MDFTYVAYGKLLRLLKSLDYAFSNYHNWDLSDRCVILRHDIDYSPDKALKMAEFELAGGVKSTYFVLLTSDFYNVYSRKTNDCLKKIIACGHDIGLHYDEMRYPSISVDGSREKIIHESRLLGAAIGSQVTTVSMHRPSKAILDADLKIPGMINSYGSEYFSSFKYLSDSRRRWREPVKDIILSGRFKRLHILTHAFWYNNNEKDLKTSLSDFVNAGNMDRYSILDDNFTHLSDELLRDEILGGSAI